MYKRISLKRILKLTLTLQCGVTSVARHSENIFCSEVTSTARHGARSHSVVYISTKSGANVIGLIRAAYLMVWETVARNYLFIFFSALEFWVFFLKSVISQTILRVPLTVK